MHCTWKMNSVGVRDGKDGGELFDIFLMSETFHLEFKRVFFTIQMNIYRRFAICFAYKFIVAVSIVQVALPALVSLIGKFCREKNELE
jgi:hypothetical protein